MDSDKEYGAKGYSETPEGPGKAPRIVGRYQYRSIPARSVQGMRQGELLRAHGWKCINAGWHTLLFEREVKHAPCGVMTEAERVRREGRA